MRGKGITFDTGFFSAGTSTREPFDPDVVRREMRVIHDDLPHRSDPRQDFDLASFGVVKVFDGEHATGDDRYPGMPWQPKAAFNTLANLYGR